VTAITPPSRRRLDPEIPADLWRRDASLRRAGELLEQGRGRLRAVSFDFFDTLVWRLTVRPADVFQEVGHRLSEAGLLAPHVSPADYEVLRRVGEVKAREHQARQDKTREDIGLGQICAQLQPVLRDPGAAARVELAAEGELCLLNPAMVEFARHAKRSGLKVLIVSDIYLSADDLRGVLRANQCDPALFDFVFTSCDAGVCKWSGNLFRHTLEATGLSAEELLHIGDNYQSDVVGARKQGIRGVHYVLATQDNYTVADRERMLLGGQVPAFSPVFLRLLAARHFGGESAAAFFGRSGAMLLGPLLTRFATWTCDQFLAAGVRRVGAFMREGELLGQMLQREVDARGLDLVVSPLYVNRKSTDLAAIGQLTAEKLMDWLGRRQTLPIRTILTHFGLRPAEMRNLPFSLEDRADTQPRILKLAEFLFTPKIAQLIEAKSAEERRKLIDYIRPWIDPDAPLGLCDVGYNASAQYQLKRIFELEGMTVPMVGCYLVTNERAASRVLDGLDVRHFLGAFGNPSINNHAFLRSPAFVEQSIVAATGTTLGYARQPDGTVTPVLDQMHFPPELVERQRAFKDGVLHYQQLWLWFRALKPGLLDGTTDFSKRVLAAIDAAGTPILARAAAYPLRTELTHFSSIPLDDYYFAEGVKRICGPTDREIWRAKGYAQTINDQGVLWPQAVHQIESPRATAEHFTYAKAMLLCSGEGDGDGALPELSVILSLGRDPAGLRECLAHLKAVSSRDFNYELVVLALKDERESRRVVQEFTRDIPRIRFIERASDEALVQQVNQAVDTCGSGLVLFLDDTVHLAAGWDTSLLAPLRANPAVAAVMPAPVSPEVAFGAFVARRGAIVEGLAFPERLGFPGAALHLLLTLRSLGWQMVIAGAPCGLAGAGDAKRLPDPDRLFLSRRWPQLAEAVAALAGPVSTPEPAALTSIIVLVLNQLEHTRACVASLFADVSSPFELIVVDNGSSDGTPAFLADLRQKQSNVHVITNRSNRGFAAGNNQGLVLARGDAVVFLNNDTVVTPGWIGRLRDVLVRQPDTGVVGPMSNCVSGPQLIQGTTYPGVGELAAFAEGWASANAGQTLEVGRAVGFCLLARREVITRIGGLDEGYGSGNFEDDDFCIRARLAGFRIRIARDAFIHHTGSQTFKDAKIDYRQAMLRNWEYFRTKWRMPSAVVLERGYPIPQVLPPGVALQIALPELQSTHAASAERDWTERPVAAVVVKPAPTGRALVLPPAAHLGQLGQARDLFQRKSLRAAWETTCGAIRVRPHHPEAFLLLGEIARQVGAGTEARACGRHALALAPLHKLTKKFLQGKFPGNTRPDWLTLPPQLKPGHPQPAGRLSVCLIVKNEEKFLGRCLASIQGLADQIVVVDTGSTDRTIAIAREHGADIHEFVWCDDFSAARNAALQHANGDWVLSLDADEELPPESHAALRRLLADQSVLGWRLPLLDIGREGDGCSIVPRLFRNAPGLFWVGRVHEQVFYSVEARGREWGLGHKIGDATLWHHGYAPEVVRERGKVARNLRLLEQAIGEIPDDPALLMNYGLELTRSDRPEEGLRQYAAACSLMLRQPPASVVPEAREALLTQYATHLLAANRAVEVTRLFAGDLARNVALTASQHFVLGVAHFKLNDVAEAAPHFRDCLALRGERSLTLANPEVRKVTPRHFLALCHWRMQDRTAAEREFLAALAEDSAAANVAVDLARMLAEGERVVDALQVLNQFVSAHPESAVIWEAGASLALSQPGLLEVAVNWTAVAVGHHPAAEALLAQRAEALMLSGQIPESGAAWSGLAQPHTPRVAAALLLCSLVSGEAGESPETEVSGAVGEEFGRWYWRLVDFGAEAVIIAIHERVDHLDRFLPAMANMVRSVIAKLAAA